MSDYLWGQRSHDRKAATNFQRNAKRRAATRERAEAKAQAKADAAIFKAYPLTPIPPGEGGRFLGAENVREGAPIPLAFGLSAAVPKTAHAAWGSRMIFQFRDGEPDVSFVPGRSDRQGESDTQLAFLHDWLTKVSGSIRAAAELALRSRTIRPDTAGRFVIFEDDRGIVVGNTNASHGYLYVAGWLK